MGKDKGWKGFLSDDERYADVINGIGCNGRQVVKKEDLHEVDTQTGYLRTPKFIHKLTQTKKENVKVRDCLRKVAFGTNFAIIGIENQETMDYSIPLRNMSYDVDAFDVAVQYTNATELIEAKEYYEKEGGVDMCKALTELIEDGREEGKALGKDEKLKEQVEKKVKKGHSISEIADMLEESEETIEKIIKSL